MDSDAGGALIWMIVLAVFAGVIYLVTRPGKPGQGGSLPGAGAAGAVYDMLNEDKRKAIEIIVEQRAEARDPEDKDGDLPQLEKPRKQ